MKKTLTKRLCRAGVIAALYAALTYAFMPFAYGPFQIRPAEALCILPLLLPEAVPALFVGCLISNIPSGLYDMFIGSSATLIAAIATYGVGLLIKKDWAKIALGGVFPVLVNAFIIPLMIVFLYGDMGAYQSARVAYFVYVGSIALTQSVWVYALGTPLYFGVKKALKAR